MLCFVSPYLYGKIVIPVPNTLLRLLLFYFVFFGTACQQRSKTINFYYWRTVFSPDSLEQKTLKDNSVQTLYIRYFDVDWPQEDTLPVPVAPIHFDSIPTGYSVIPVVFIRNRVFEKLPSATLPALTGKVFALVRRINNSARVQPGEIQFDCDWTERTKDNYFSFLRQYRQRSGARLSCTIRLHQVKYSDRTGIPPVDHGVLMFYNMGNIDAGSGSSIYDRSIAHRYTPSLRSYPLMLDLALPVTGSLSADNLLQMVGDVNRHSNHRIRNLIFFDLDRQNLQQYDKNLFKEILDHTD